MEQVPCLFRPAFDVRCFPPGAVVGRVGGWVGATRIELDPVAAASGCDDRHGAVDPDQSGGAVHDDRLGCRAASLLAGHLLDDPILGRGIADRLRREGQEQFTAVPQGVDIGLSNVEGAFIKFATSRNFVARMGSRFAD